MRVGGIVRLSAFGGLEIDGQYEFCRKFDGQIVNLGTFQNLVNVVGRSLIAGHHSYGLVRRSGNRSPMSALGQKRTFGSFIAMSAIPPKADISHASLASGLSESADRVATHPAIQPLYPIECATRPRKTDLATH